MPQYRVMSRIQLNLNRDWRFIRRDVSGAETPDFNDSDWARIGLPHCFDLPYFRTPEFYVGFGWYRRKLTLPDIWTNKRLFLEFEGVFQEAEIFVNGIRVGSHMGGYTGFSIDITSAAKPGENLLAIRVNNHWNPQVSPRAGEHVFLGGIYRDVHLVVKDPLHIAWYGVCVTTPHVSHESAMVKTVTDIQNDDDHARQCTVRQTIVDPNGQPIQTFESAVSLAPKQSIELEQKSKTIPNPKLWHPDHPNLYRVITQILEDNQVRDETASPLGFRWFEWTADRGFFLNGKHYYLRGANVHQDHAGWGIGITQNACYRDLKLIKDCGMNFVRGAHYPHHPAFSRGCDEIGLLFWSENCFWGKGGFGPEGYWNASAYPVNEKDFAPFEDHCKQTLREMIRIHRNHPSIIAWSMTNEAFFTYHLDKARNLIGDLVKLSRELDPTRPAAVGGAQRGDVDKLGDIAGYNGDGALLFLDPGVPNMVSEYGAISKPPTAFEPFWGEKQTELFPWRAGEAIWCGFDYGSIAGRQGLKGIADHFRIPKRSWEWYRQAYLGVKAGEETPCGLAAKLVLSSEKPEIIGTNAVDDCQVTVTVLDAAGNPVNACPVVTLSILSGPGEFPTGSTITFDPSTDIKITEGKAAIALRSYFSGITVVRATSPGLQDAAIEIRASGSEKFDQGVTPRNTDRPYTPPEESEAAKAAMRNAADVARDRPSRASSAAPDHPARYANNADPTTGWRAASPDAGQWWMLDLEGFYEISSLRLTFPQEANYRFVVETSENRIDWQTAIDRSATVNTGTVRNDVFPPGLVARYLRLTFTSLPAPYPAALNEVAVYGILSVR